MPFVSDWGSGKVLIPLRHCPYIEQFTEGAVTCEELRPDMAAYFALIRELAPAQRCRPESEAPPAAVVGQGVVHG